MDERLFYRSLGPVENKKECFVIKKGSIVSTDTYMNSFDCWAWNKYTGQQNWVLKVKIQGDFFIRLCAWDGKKKLILQENSIDAKDIFRDVVISFQGAAKTGLIFLEIEAVSDTCLYQAAYCLNEEKLAVRKIQLSLIICTYQRNQELYANLERIKESLFFDKDSSYYGGMCVRIVDNASELPKNIEQAGIYLYHNPNTGGSGGFTRGVLESRQDEKRDGITHVIFMDDDARVELESFYRLYGLLCFVLPKYRDVVVAGRMFSLEEPCVQYTAAECWNQGDVRHVGYQQDMRERSGLLEMNQSLGEYSGWWFACFPMSFVREEIPLPFFIHCDDVEYGLRHGGKPILLNGIQVWHETYENRQSAFIYYYDIRNAMIVNTIYGFCESGKELLKKWLLRVMYDFRAKKYFSLYPSLQAMIDYCKGREFFFAYTEKKEKLALQRTFAGLFVMVMICIRLPVFWIKINRAFQSFKEINT
ncbi:MAG: glycosyltransferase [Lachnospiraceae bacterium]|nr:glycosyltransferase [Lachnospiraceae bacterium]